MNKYVSRKALKFDIDAYKRKYEQLKNNDFDRLEIAGAYYDDSRTISILSIKKGSGLHKLIQYWLKNKIKRMEKELENI